MFILILKGSFPCRRASEQVEDGQHRDVQLGIEFPAINWYDGTGFLVHKALNVTSVKNLDGATIWDSGDKPVTDDKLTVAERPCKPGPHALTLRLEVRPGTKKKGKDIEGLGYSSEQTFTIDVPDGKRTTIALTGDEDGPLPNYEPRIELELESEAIKK